MCVCMCISLCHISAVGRTFPFSQWCPGIFHHRPRCFRDQSPSVTSLPYISNTMTVTGFAPLVLLANGGKNNWPDLNSYLSLTWDSVEIAKIAKSS